MAGPAAGAGGRDADRAAPPRRPRRRLRRGLHLAAWLAWHGWWAAALGALFAVEIVITMSDFVVEDRVRRPLGGVYPGERVTHGIMAVVYGAVLGRLVPVLREWWHQPSGLVAVAPDVPMALRVGLTAMGVGIALSGLRDLYAARGGRYGAWPWTASPA